MEEKELREVLSLLKAAGVDAMLCDTLVPVSGSPVVCGLLAEPGDEDWSEYVMLPKSVVGRHPELYIPAEGDSMRDAGYEPGDMLRVRLGVEPRDGDSVVVMIDGRCTVKSLGTDEDGKKWLVPQNERYNAIPLTNYMDVYMLGVVVGVEKASPRASTRTMLQAIRRTKNSLRTASRLTEKELDTLIVKISAEITISRQWYSVYRAMVDCGVWTMGDIQGFCNRVKQLLPDFNFLPDAKDLASRMDVMSFAKPLTMWTERNAPVGGARFEEYRRIAMKMTAYLTEKEEQ